MATKKSVDIIVKAKDKASGKFRKVGRSATSMGSMIKRAGAAAAAYFGARAIKDFATSSLAAFGRQEQAVKGLSDALDLLGAGGQSTMEGMKQFAASIQKQTVIGDEAVMELAALGASLGRLSGQSLKDATVAAIGLSKRMGVDVVSAMRLVSRAAIGDTSTLTRYGIKLSETLSPQEKFNQLLKMGAESFALAKGETETYAGRIKQLGNTWGDMKEKVGKAIVPIIEEWLPKLQSWIESITEKDIRNMISRAKVLGYTLLTVWGTTKLLKGMFRFSVYLKSTTRALRLGQVMALRFKKAIRAASLSIIRLGVVNLAAIGSLAVLAAGFAYVAYQCSKAKARMREVEQQSMQWAKLSARQSAAKKRSEQASTATEKKRALEDLLSIRERMAESLQEDAADDNLEEHQRKNLRGQAKRMGDLVEQTRKQIAETSKRAGEEEKQRIAKMAKEAAAVRAKAEAEEYEKRNAELKHRINVIKARSIEDQQKKEIELIRLRYKREIEIAKKAGKDIALLEKARQLEIEQVRARHEKKAFDETLKTAVNVNLNLKKEKDKYTQAEGPAGPRQIAAVEARFLTRAPGHYNPYDKVEKINIKIAKNTENMAKEMKDFAKAMKEEKVNAVDKNIQFEMLKIPAT